MKINKGKSKLPWQFTKEKLLLQQTEIWHTIPMNTYMGTLKLKILCLTQHTKSTLQETLIFLEMNEHKVYRTLKL